MFQNIGKGFLRGKSGSDWITHYDVEKFKTKFACEVKNFNPTDHFDRKQARKLDRFTQYIMVAAEEAMKDAEFNMDKIDRNRFGVIVGSGIGGIGVFYEQVKGFVEGDGTPRINPFFIPQNDH